MLNGRDRAKLEAAAGRLQAVGLKASFVTFDVSDPIEVAKGIAEIEAEHGPIDILVNNAGIQRRAPLEEFRSRPGTS